MLLRPSGPTGDALYLRADRTGGFEPAVDITKEISFNAQHWSAAYHEAYSADWDGDGRDEPLLRALTEDDRTYLVYLPVE